MEMLAHREVRAWGGKGKDERPWDLLFLSTSL